MNNHIIFQNKNMKLSQAYHFFLLVILLSSTTLGSVPKYAKTGCKDMCGKVRIPFPFGIGENCSLKKWYNVDCNSSTPYLSSLNHLEVLRVDLQNRTVTVKMQKFSNCSQTTKSVDLGGSPFLYSKSHNTLVYEGYCGNAVMMDNHGSVLTGCSTTCSNDTTITGIIDTSHTSNCFGIDCCQTKIPKYLESYSMNLTGIEMQMGGDGGCGSAYLLDKESYTEGNHLSRQLARDGTSYIPTSLQWILSYHDHEQVSCSGQWYPGVMDLGNGTVIISWYCYTFSTIEGNPYLIDGYEIINIDSSDSSDSSSFHISSSSGGPPITWADYFPKGYSGSRTKKEDARKVKTPKKTAEALFGERFQVLGLPNPKTCEDKGIKPCEPKMPKVCSKGKG